MRFILLVVFVASLTPNGVLCKQGTLRTTAPRARSASSPTTGQEVASAGLRVLNAPPAPPYVCPPGDIDARNGKKLVVVVRHGESTWNSAGGLSQAGQWIKSKFSNKGGSIDNPLNLDGLKDALSFNCALRDCPVGGGGHFAPGALASGVVTFGAGGGNTINFNSLVTQNNVAVKPNNHFGAQVCLAVGSGGQQTLRDAMRAPAQRKLWVSNLRRAIDTGIIGMADAAHPAVFTMTSDIQEHSTGPDATSKVTADGNTSPLNGDPATPKSNPSTRGDQYAKYEQMCAAGNPTAANFLGYMQSRYRAFQAGARTANKPTGGARCPIPTPAAHGIRYEIDNSPESKHILFGHSHYFREFVSQFVDHPNIATIPGCAQLVQPRADGKFPLLLNGAAVAFQVNPAAAHDHQWIEKCVMVYGAGGANFKYKSDDFQCAHN